MQNEHSGTRFEPSISRINGRTNSPSYPAAKNRVIVGIYDHPEFIPTTAQAQINYCLRPLESGFLFNIGDTLYEYKIPKSEMRRNIILHGSEKEFDNLFTTIATYSMDLDSESKLHEIRSSFIARYIAELVGIDTNTQLFRNFLIGALIHDDGKGDQNIKERIRKRFDLSAEDRNVTHLHPTIGTLRALMNGLEGSAEYPLTHHVFFDRSTGEMQGYPDTIIDSEITGIRMVDSDGNTTTIADMLNLSPEKRAQYIFLKQILKLTDEVDAFCSRRVYRPNRLTRDQLKSHLEKSSGSRFNPEAVNIVIVHIDELRFFHYLMYRMHNQKIFARPSRTADGCSVIKANFCDF